MCRSLRSLFLSGLYLSIFLTATAAFSANRCESALLGDDTAQLMYDLHVEKDGEGPNIYLTGREFYPEASTLNGIPKPNFKPRFSWRIESNPDKNDSSFRFVKGMLENFIGFSEFYNAVYSHYAPKIREKLVALLTRLDKELPVARQTVVTVINYNNRDEVFGAARVVEGTKAKPSTAVLGTDDNSIMPFEQLLAARNMGRAWLEFLQRLRQQFPFQRMFELGRYYLSENSQNQNKDFAYRVRKRAQKMIEVWLLRFFANRYPDGWMFGYCVGTQTRDYFTERYGYQVLAEIPITNEELIEAGPEQKQKVEYLMVVHHQDFKTALRKRLGLPVAPEAESNFGKATKDLMHRFKSLL
jgi:hypothetical protein